MHHIFLENTKDTNAEIIRTFCELEGRCQGELGSEGVIKYHFLMLLASNSLVFCSPLQITFTFKVNLY